MMNEKDEVIAEPNTEPINFRVPLALKKALQEMAEYEMIASVGELLRAISRAHIQEVTNTHAYKAWAQRKAAEEAAERETEEKNP